MTTPPEDPSVYYKIDALPDRCPWFEPLNEHEAYEETFDATDILEVVRHFVHPVEIHLGTSPETPVCYLLPGGVCPPLSADLILVQPDVMKRDVRRGWVPLGGVHYYVHQFVPNEGCLIGKHFTPQLELAEDVGDEHLRIQCADANFPNIQIVNLAGCVTRVRMHYSEFI